MCVPIRTSTLMLLLPLLACDNAPQPRTDARGGDGSALRDGATTRHDGALPLTDGGLPAVDGPPIDPAQDSDGDGLPDGFELLFPGFDPQLADSDGDGIPDGEEDKDGDGLTAAQEWAIYADPRTIGPRPSPLRKDLAIELDAQQGFAPSSAVLTAAIAAFAAVDLPNLDGSKGISLQIIPDETDLPVAPLPGDLQARMDYLGAHGPKHISGPHAAKLVHVIFAGERPDAAGRGGDTVGASDTTPDRAGALIYAGNLAKILPVCNAPGSPAVTLEEGTSSTCVHELGHVLQLGHDTEVGGGVNPYNVMSTDLGECDKLKQRTRGVGNTDPSLGASETGGAPRFSAAAAQLMKLRNKISVEASGLEVENGHEM